MKEEFSPRSKAIIGYITFVGMFIAMSMNSENKDEFATWHIKNMFGLFLLWIISVVTQYYILGLVGEILWYLIIIFWFFSLAMAILRKKRGIPILSKKFQEWFTFLD